MKPFPTDPYVTNSVIRFFGNQSDRTTLTHNFATLQTIKHCGRFLVLEAGISPSVLRTFPMVFYFCGFVDIANNASLVPQSAAPIPWLPCYNEYQSIENARVTSMTGFYVATPSTYVDLCDSLVQYQMSLKATPISNTK